ncbi:Fur family transcriptional regulator [Microbacterium sp. SORGH_AS_0888]|uniref:Fur family transcriptional regulator n=1 Tax=Microbacterium sp. SORGH_AS_0888 TaxID=3041791 RepID=UPI0027822768|nr:Fur family transcriptional regulator [Microbacterium sp. SORGH_AS_0888]MDQ1127912.1 Fe2+ or Zn2+ uptake regulation protein [Microbacterium sp. SORGH_AS_0888]
MTDAVHDHGAHAHAPSADVAIRTAGLRVTATRRAVYDALEAQPHARAEQVLDRVRETLDASSMQSVYNALGDFVDAGLVRRIEPAGHPGLYEMRVDDNHHHLVCSGCGRVEDVDCVVGAAPCLQPSETHGYRIHTAEVTFWGLCSDCAASAS